MFRDLKNKYGECVLHVLRYDWIDHLVAVRYDAIVRPALEKSDGPLLARTAEIRSRHVRDYVP
jgi:hypothetical protein